MLEISFSIECFGVIGVAALSACMAACSAPSAPAESSIAYQTEEGGAPAVVVSADDMIAMARAESAREELSPSSVSSLENVAPTPGGPVIRLTIGKIEASLQGADAPAHTVRAAFVSVGFPQ